MQWANIDGTRHLPKRGPKAKCPACGGEVIAKCGEIVSWHWAHKVKDCDPWSEPESEWHKEWKSRFPPQWQECTIGQHRADVVSPIGVIEFQRSFLSPAEIRERECFYSDLVWVVNASSWALKRKRRRPAMLVQRDQSGALYYVIQQDFTKQSFQWNRPRKTWMGARKPVYLDIGAGSNHVYLIESIGTEKAKTVIGTRQIRKTDFLLMCYGLPGRLPPLLMNSSSFDYYADAMKRRLDVMASASAKSQLLTKGLPLFAVTTAGPGAV